jgi:hypothetical protein
MHIVSVLLDPDLHTPMLESTESNCWTEIPADLFDRDGSWLGPTWTRPIRPSVALQVEDVGRRARMMMVPVHEIVIQRGDKVMRVPLSDLGIDQADGVVIGTESRPALCEADL